MLGSSLLLPQGRQASHLLLSKPELNLVVSCSPCGPVPSLHDGDPGVLLWKSVCMLITLICNESTGCPFWIGLPYVIPRSSQYLNNTAQPIICMCIFPLNLKNCNRASTGTLTTHVPLIAKIGTYVSPAGPLFPGCRVQHPGVVLHIFPNHDLLWYR